MKFKVLSVVLAVLCLLLGASLARVENERYALSLGMCRDKLGIADASCLQKTQTRTHWFWHVFHAMTS